MRQYETMVIIDAMISDDTINAEVENIGAMITNGGGEILRRDDWGKRKLAYAIDKLTDGEYTLINFHTAPEAISELDRVLRITDAVARHMIVHRSDRD